MKIFCVFLFLILSVACSNQDLYQLGQDYQESECINAAYTATLYFECVKVDRKSYEEYENERKTLIHKN
jgi:hypothetical protein